MRSPGSLGFDRVKVVALLRLRWRTAFRRVSRERGRLVGGVLLAVIGLPIAIGVAFATGVGYDRLPGPLAAQLLAAVLTGLWLMWIIAPVLSVRVNEGLDITRLLVYPIQRRDLTASMLLGTLLDLPTYFALPLLAAVVVGWWGGAASLFVVAAVAVAFMHMVLAGQIVVTGAGGLLRSRRFRDVSVIVVSLLGSMCYFIQRGAIELGERYVDGGDLERIRILPIVQWLPPGAAARSIERASAGAWAESVVWLAYSSVLLAAVAWLWWRLMTRLTTGGGFPVIRPSRSETQEAPTRRGDSTVPRLLRWLPSDLAVVASKELRSVWRTPRRRVMLLQNLLMPLVLGAFVFMRTDRPDTMPAWSGLGIVFYALLASGGTTRNMLGFEGTGLPLLLLTPAPRDRVMLGKGLGLVAVTSGAIAVLGLGLLVLVPNWISAVGVLIALCVAPIAVGVGAVVSVRFPYAIDLESTRSRNTFTTSGGCLTALADLLVTPIATGLLVLPLVGALAVAALLDQPGLALVVAVLAPALGGAVLWVGTRYAGRDLVTREPEVVAATKVAD